MTTAPTTIMAYTAEDDGYLIVRNAAERTARETGGRLILFDVSTAGTGELGTDPTTEARVNLSETLLGPDRLEHGGHPGLAGQVRHARAAGIDAYGFIPESAAADAVARYAVEQGADMVLVPESLADAPLRDVLRGRALPMLEERVIEPLGLVRDNGSVVFV